MSEFDEKLNALLSDPDRMAQIMQMAQSLSGGGPPPPEQPQSPPSPPPFQPQSSSLGGDLLSSLTGSFDPKMLIKLAPLLQELGSDSSSQARSLLYALRPYLKADRQERIEKALQLARLLRVGKKFFTSWEGSGV